MEPAGEAGGGLFLICGKFHGQKRDTDCCWKTLAKRLPHNEAL